MHEVYAGDSIQTAVDTSAPGDTILVHAGTYAPVSLTRTFAPPLEIAGVPGEDVTVGGFTISAGAGYRISLLMTTGQTIVEDGAHDVVFDRIRCTLPAGDPSNTASCFYLHDSSYDLTISHSVIRGGWVGVHVYSASPGPGAGWARDIRVTDNDISGATIDDIHVNGADGMLIMHNFIHDPQANDQHNDGVQSQASNNLTITQNTFSFTAVAAGLNVGTAIILGNLPGTFPDRRVTNTSIRNNLVAHWQPGRALIVDGTESTRVVNNTFVDNGNSGPSDVSVTVANPGPGGENADLEIWNNILNSIYVEPGTDQPSFCDTNLLRLPRRGMSGTHVITINPRFVDRRTYALARSSRARRRGLVRAGTPRRDIDGRLRTLPPALGARE